MNIAVFISGNGSNLQSLINAVNSGEIKSKIKLVFSNKASAYGLTRARENGIDTFTLNRKDFDTNEQYDEKIYEVLKKYNIDVIVLAGYLLIVSEFLTKKYERKIINIHPSLIPSFCGKGYYGSKIHESVINSGVKVTGLTTHFVDAGVDTGPIIFQEVVKVENDDTAESIAKKVLEKEHSLIVKTVKAFCENKVVVKGNKTVVLED